MQVPFVLKADSYKYNSLHNPPELSDTHFYIEARKPANDEMIGRYGSDSAWNNFVMDIRPDLFNKVVFFGLQAYLREYFRRDALLTRLPSGHSVRAFVTNHGLPFNEASWLRLIALRQEKDNFYPVVIKAVPEGSVVPVRTPLVTVQNLGAEFSWFPSFIETALLRAVWYPTAVATKAWQIRQVCKYFLNLTTTDDVAEGHLKFMLHDFGARGCSSSETAQLGGMGHLTQFDGTDNLEGMCAAVELYDADPMNLAFSIPAAEHSSIMAWGKKREAEAFKHILEVNVEATGVSIVSDTYDLANALTEIWGKTLKDFVTNRKIRSVIRPDSGNPLVIPELTIQQLMKSFGSTTNAKGFKVLPSNLRVIQGDGVNLYSIFKILQGMYDRGISAENIVFGMGGELLQAPMRDDYGWAMKLSATAYEGQSWVPRCKEVATDPGKKSKAGRFLVEKTVEGSWITHQLETAPASAVNQLRLVWDGVSIVKPEGFDVIRERARN